MNIIPKDGPSVVQPAGANAQAQMTARERAISMLTQAPANTQETPVLNPNRISAEELSAIRAPSNPVQSDTIEEAPKAAEATDESREPLSTHYARLARREKELRAEAQRLQRDREAMKAAQAAVKPAEVDTSKFVSREDLLKDPFSILNDLGLTYDQLTQSALNQPKPEELRIQKLEQDLRNELRTVREAQEKANRDAADMQTRSYQQAVDQIRNEAKNLVTSDPSAFEAISATNSINDVVELIETTFKEEGVLMSVEDAAKAVEDYLVEEAMKFAKMKKIQNRLVPAAPVKAAAAAPAANKDLRTLTNNVSSSRPLSATERAILAFKGELK